VGQEDEKVEERKEDTMERIYEVRLEYPYDYSVYFVRAGDVGVAAGLALQTDEASAAGQALKGERAASNPPRVTRVMQFCSTEQFVG
jgi:hypothetical protein